MGERTDQIERHIAETRSELGDDLGELQDKVKSAFDWRIQFQERPGTLLAVAFGSGVVLSALLPSASSKSGSNAKRDSTSQESARSRPSDLAKTINAFTGALLGVAVKQASGFLDSMLPGFHNEFTKASDIGSRRDESIDAGYTSESSLPPLAAKAGA
jgi:hypothetical protein